MSNELIWNGPVLGQPRLQRGDQDIQLDDGPDLEEKIWCTTVVICCCGPTETMFETGDWIMA